MRAWLDRSLYPFESRYFETPHDRLHYVDEGEGAPIVMVHGNPTWSFLYRHVIAHFRARYRCVAMDHLGFGLSDKPGAFSYHPRLHAENVAQLLDSLDLREITLVVQDWGGPIGLSYALAQPERVARILIMNTWFWPVADVWHYRLFSGFMGGPVGRWLVRRFNFFARVVVPAVYGDRGRLTERIHRHYLAPLAEPAERKGSWVFPGQIVGATPWLTSLWAEQEKLSAIPKRIVWGMADRAFREQELAKWVATYPETAVERLEGVGHYVQEEAPGQLNAAIEALLSQ